MATPIQAQTSKKTGPVGRLRFSLSRECGEFTKMYHALFEVCGGDLQAKSTATVWTAIIDRVSNDEVRGNIIEDGGLHWIPFNDDYWLARLRMSRPTFKAALDWLEDAAAIQIRKVKGEWGYPARQVALNNAVVEALIHETRGKGGNHRDLEYPLFVGNGVMLTAEEAKTVRLEKASAKVRKPPKPKTGKGVDSAEVSTETSIKPFTDTHERLDTYPSKVIGGKYQAFSDQLASLDAPTSNPLITEKKEEEVRRVKEDIRDTIYGNSDGEEGSRNTATRRASTSALLRNFEHNSFDSGEIKPEHPGQKETELAQAKASGEKREYADRDWLGEVQASGLKELIEVEEPWRFPVEYGDVRKLHKVSVLGWKYAVRGSVFIRDLTGKGTPLDTWPVSGDHSDQDKIHALVQATIDIRDRDPWESVEGWQDTDSFPSFEDPAFRAAYIRRLKELDPTATSDYL